MNAGTSSPLLSRCCYAAGCLVLAVWMVAKVKAYLPQDPGWSAGVKEWMDSRQQSEPDRKLPPIRGLATPRALPVGPEATAARARAVAAYPQLGVAGSPLNRAFVARVIHYQVERPEIFDDPEWPTRIARECERDLPPAIPLER